MHFRFFASEGVTTRDLPALGIDLASGLRARHDP